jgi:hypothetical protein
MAKAHNIVSISIGPTLRVIFYRNEICLKVSCELKTNPQLPYLQISQDWQFCNDIRYDHDEFLVLPIGKDRTLLKEVKESGTFIDTGKRVRFNTNLWGEVWRLNPEHLALLQEKETQDEQAPSEHQSEHLHRPNRRKYTRTNARPDE